MFIKEVRVNGFKSFKDEVVIGEFDPGVNIVVGRNGAGKSNLFSAIQFALNLEESMARGPLARRELLHHAKPNYDLAFVEVVFDNTDRKMPVNSDVVTFRRIVSCKKDKFFCNGKPIKSVKDFLDSATINNPYFIVKQGKVQRLATGDDAFRLKLVMDVAGATTFLDKVREFKKDLSDADKKKAEIEEKLDTFEKRKVDLEEELEGLRKFTELDKRRRGVEYVLNQRGQDSKKLIIQKLDDEMKQLFDKMEPATTKLQDVQRALRTVIEELVVAENDVHCAKAREESVQAEILNLQTEKVRLVNMLGEIDTEMNDSEKLKLTPELNKKQTKLKYLQQTLDKAKKEFEEAKQHEKTMEKRVVECLARKQALEVKLTGQSDVGQHLEALKNEYADKKEIMKKLEKELKNSEKEREEVEQSLKVEKGQLEEIVKELSEVRRKSHEPELRLFDAEKTKSELWTTLNETETKLAHLNVRLECLKAGFKERAGWEAMKTWENVQEAVEQLRQEGHDDVIQGYHGTLLENIDCAEELELAVEVAGSNCLFHHVVKNRDVGRKILNTFNRKKLRGSPHFIPLEGLEISRSPLPQSADIFRSLIESIKYPQAVRNAVQYVFGKTLLCRELLDAVAAARMHKLKCVTLDGDKVSGLGPMRGGYFHNKMGLMELQRGKVAAENKKDSLSLEKVKIENSLQEINETIRLSAKAKELSESQRCRLTSKKETCEFSVKQLEAKLKLLKQRIANARKDVDQNSMRIVEATCRESELKKLQKDQKSMPLSKCRKEILTLRNNLKPLYASKKAALTDKLKKENAVSEIENEAKWLEEEIENDGRKKLEKASVQELQERLYELKQMLLTTEREIKRKTSEAKKMEGIITALITKEVEKKRHREEAQEKEAKVRKQISRFEENLQKARTAWSGHKEQLQELTDDAANKGTIPSETVHYKDLSSKELEKKLKTTVKKLKKITNVNQKAAQEHAEITELCTRHKDRLEHAEESRKEMENLLKDLSEMKGDLVLKTFRVLQEQFDLIFTEIVPDGVAELVLYGDDCEVRADSQDSEELRSFLADDSLIGVKINANFIDKRRREMKNLLSLSGGQKSVVALSLILAIQKIDPVPLYMLDEVDAALDPTYRSRITNVMLGIANQFKHQFICTTFNKEFLSGANKFFGVSYHNECSTVREVTRNEAENFVETGSESDDSSTPGISGESSDSSSHNDSNQSGNDNEMETGPTQEEESRLIVRSDESNEITVEDMDWEQSICA